MLVDAPPAAAQPPAEQLPYWSLSADEVLLRLGTSRRGLPASEAVRRLAQYGSNTLAQERGTPLWQKFAANLTSFFAVLLWIAAALSLFTGSVTTCVAIVAVILINAVFAFYQEFRPEQATEALKRLLPAYARVRRGG